MLRIGFGLRVFSPRHDHYVWIARTNNVTSAFLDGVTAGGEPADMVLVTVRGHENVDLVLAMAADVFRYHHHQVLGGALWLGCAAEINQHVSALHSVVERQKKAVTETDLIATGESVCQDGKNSSVSWNRLRLAPCDFFEAFFDFFLEWVVGLFQDLLQCRYRWGKVP